MNVGEGKQRRMSPFALSSGVIMWAYCRKNIVLGQKDQRRRLLFCVEAQNILD